MAFIVLFGSEFAKTTILTAQKSKNAALVRAWNKIISMFGQCPEQDRAEVERLTKMLSSELKSFEFWGASAPVQRKGDYFQAALTFSSYKHELVEISKITEDEYVMLLNHKDILNLVLE